MNWTQTDRDKFYGEIKDCLEDDGTDDELVTRLVDLMAGTLLLYNCPIPELYVMVKIEEFLDLFLRLDLVEKLRQDNPRLGPKELLAFSLTEWVANTINRNNPTWQ